MRGAVVLLFATLPLHAQTLYPPDAATLKEIEAKTAELKKSVDILKARYDETKSYVPHVLYGDVAVYWKAADWIVRHNEWYTKEAGKQTILVLQAGLDRAVHALQGKAPWWEIRGKPIIRGEVSDIDDSIQPYSVIYPEGMGMDGKDYRCDIVLHGRDATLTEVKFIASREAAARPAQPLDAIIAEPYGRGNNAFRWSGEESVLKMDVFECTRLTPGKFKNKFGDRRVLRGFSMGGAGTWHLGLHQPFSYSALAPGAGFTVTRGYVKDLPAKLPDHIERCLHIYDAADYAENAANIPIVAYSGEKDPQIAAVRNIEARLRDYPEKLRFTHFVAPGLEHKMPAEWVDKVNVQIKTEALDRMVLPKKVHFVTYYNRYCEFGHGEINGLERQYDRAVIDSALDGKTLTMTTKNVAAVYFNRILNQVYETVVIDGTTLSFPTNIRKVNGVWKDMPGGGREYSRDRKSQRLHGPIDDAFMYYFNVIPPSESAMNPATAHPIRHRYEEFARLWDKYFRGKFHVNKPFGGIEFNEVLFGDPGSNPRMAELIEKLPLKWTASTLEVNGKRYDPKTHFPVMIYPHPTLDSVYVVLNSGHTFGEADLKGSNALLYPRLGDWAVLKLAPTKDDPHHTEVVDAGIFDENWQFEKKK